MFCNNNIARVLRKLFAFTHYKMFLVWHIGHETPFYRPSVSPEPTNINFHWRRQDCFLITDRFQLVSWLSMPFCTFLSSCVQYFFRVSFHFITQILIYEPHMFCFLCIYGLLGLFPTSGENFMSRAPLEIYLLRNMVTCSILILPAVFLWRKSWIFNVLICCSRNIYYQCWNSICCLIFLWYFFRIPWWIEI